MIRRILFIFICSLCWYSSSQAAVVLDAQTQSVALDGHIDVLEDPGGKLSLSEVQQRSADFKPVRQPGEFNLGYSDSHWWLRVTVQSTLNAPNEWRLQLSYPPLDSVEAWLPEGKSWQVFRTGDRVDFSARPTPNRHFVFPLHLTPGESATLYLRVASQGTLTVPLQILSEQAYAERTELSYVFASIYFGMLFALGAYNLLLFFSVRDRAYLYYVLFVSGLAIGQAGQSGLASQYLWPHLPLLANLAFPLGFAAAGLFGTVFTRVFLDTKTQLPRLDFGLQIIAAVFAIGALLSLVSYRFGSILLSSHGVLFSCFAVWVGVVSLRRGNPSARLFLIAWTVMLVGAAALGLRTLNLIPTNPITLFGLQIGSALEMLLLSFALADRINQMRRAKIDAQSNVLASERKLRAALENNEKRLEARVLERTIELESANQQLKENEERFRQLAQHDPLTGLANRLLLYDRLEHLLHRSRRNAEGFAVLMLDLDGFKAINDTYGHAAGDTLLAKIAQRLQNRMRSSDTVARIGGDEFAILLEQSANEEDARRAADGLLGELTTPVVIDEKTLATVGGSIGIALWPRDGDDAESLLRAADHAMYQSKQNGKPVAE